MSKKTKSRTIARNEKLLIPKTEMTFFKASNMISSTKIKRTKINVFPCTTERKTTLVEHI